MTGKWRIILILSLIANASILYVAYKALEYRGHINHFLEKYTEVVDEFSQRKVYDSANVPLRSDTTVHNRIVFFGTQVTEHWQLTDSFSAYEAINRGVSGQRVAGLLLRFRPDVIELRPEAVVIEVSSYNFRPNAAVKEIGEYVASMAELARAHGIRPILTSVIPPTTDFDVFEHSEYKVKDSVEIYNHWLTEYAASGGFDLADFAATVSDAEGFLDPRFASSHVDLNDTGYTAVSEVILRLLEQDQ